MRNMAWRAISSNQEWLRDNVGTKVIVFNNLSRQICWYSYVQEKNKHDNQPLKLDHGEKGCRGGLPLAAKS